MDINTMLAKWLKKAKLRDGSHSVFFSGNTFHYRGFTLSYIHKNIIMLKWPATFNKVEEGSFWGPDEELSIADPKFFIKLKRSFRTAMTYINTALAKKDVHNT